MSQSDNTSIKKGFNRFFKQDRTTATEDRGEEGAMAEEVACGRGR